VKLPACGRAAGKVILLGEHAVVYGRPALAAGLALGLEVEVKAGKGAARVVTDRPEVEADSRPLHLVKEAAAVVGIPPRDLVVSIRSELPPGAGLGSSAALSVAVLRALADAVGRSLGRDEELGLGRRLEAIFHGHPSGVAAAAAALGGCFRFVRGDPPTITPLRPARAIPLVVALARRPRSTGAAVGGLRARWRRTARVTSGSSMRSGRRRRGAHAALAGDLAALGRAFDQNQALLVELGVSAPEVDELVSAARAAGALGAKLTGGGAGGAVLALAPRPSVSSPHCARATWTRWSWRWRHDGDPSRARREREPGGREPRGARDAGDRARHAVAGRDAARARLLARAARGERDHGGGVRLLQPPARPREARPGPPDGRAHARAPAGRRELAAVPRWARQHRRRSRRTSP
jgi:mevalonate kinase